MRPGERIVFVTLLYLVIITGLYFLFRYGPLAIQWFALLIARIPS